MSTRSYAGLAKAFSALLLLPLLVAVMPESSAATNVASPTPTPTSSARPWTSTSTTPRSGASASTTPTPKASTSPTPTPSATSNVPPLTPVYADTEAPQIVSLETDVAYSGDLFTVSFLLKTRIHRNTLQSISIQFKPKVVTGALTDPIFQAPCTKVENASVSSLAVDGNSTALQSRSKVGDWFIEEYVLQSVTRLAKGQGPCLGSYLTSGISLVDSAKHTLSVDANLASTTPATTGANKTPSASAYTDVAIMQSNIWNSRLDLAPCVAGSNLAPSLTSVVINGKTTQALVAPTIVSTNRVACAPTIAANLSSPLFTIKEDSFLSDVNALAGLKIFNYANQVNQNSVELAKLRSDIDSLTAQNALLLAEITKLKTPAVVTPTPKPSATTTKKPSATTTKKPTATTTKKPSVTSTQRPGGSHWRSNQGSNNPNPKWTQSSSTGNPSWQGRATSTPKATPKATTTSKSKK